MVREPDNDDMFETLTILSYNIGKLSGLYCLNLVTIETESGCHGTLKSCIIRMCLSNEKGSE